MVKTVVTMSRNDGGDGKRGVCLGLTQWWNGIADEQQVSMANAGKRRGSRNSDWAMVAIFSTF